MSRSSAAERVPTFEELYRAIEALPEGLTGEILEPGVIRTMARPGSGHRFAAKGLGRELGDEDVLDGGSWWIEQEAEVRFLTEHLVVPDLSGWRLEQDESVPPAFVAENRILRCPTWCCEVLSPTTERIDRHTKVPLYASAGVEWIWLVDPEARRIEVLRTVSGEASPVLGVEADARRVLPPFSVELDAGRLWLPPPR